MNEEDEGFNEVAAVLGICTLFPSGAVDCHSWAPIELGETGAELDFCAVCGGAEDSHPEDAFGDQPPA